ncbi:fumarylacetoacetate hydrolase family protein [Alicyclobacillus macrosporangiidus]|uniref:fumarylacetoacetate hydrolase family protein n=1 Tax=Alicyclobacillus macrosporangiidus TaxID=392015 RepID=UPI0026EE0174|nr:fumarylacetoacetate hydrolase family protein [Alicyclobacillus macrosporangiidus]
MKLLTYSLDKHTYRLGILLDENVLCDPQRVYLEKLKALGQARADIVANALLPSAPADFLNTGDLAIRTAQEALEYASRHSNLPGIYQLDRVHLGAPIWRPGKIICVGLNYKDHIAEMGRDFPAHPVIFAKYATAVAGPFDAFPWKRSLTKKLDYEGELAVVIGKRAKNVSQESALEYVAGYTIANDISARDLQKRTIQWLQGKTLDKSLPIGPYLVTKDEIPDPHNLDIRVTVNGQPRQKSNTSQLLFNVNQLVEFLSNLMTLEPGDIICTGTPGGVGEAQNLFLDNGDVVRVEIEQIGFLETRITEVNE